MLALRRAHGARRPRLGSHRAAHAGAPRRVLGRRRYARCSKCALPPTPSEPRAPLRLACPPPPPQDTGGSPPPWPQGLGTSDPRVAPNPNLPTNRGKAVSVQPAQPGGMERDPPPPPPPTAADISIPAPPSAHPNADPPGAPLALRGSCAPASCPPAEQAPPPAADNRCP